jgi:hypothetical protein
LITSVAHRWVVPVIANGKWITVTGKVALQPVGKVYVIAVAPTATPVTMPDADPTVAIGRLPLLHVPPLLPSVKAVVCPWHTDEIPVIPPGSGLTVTIANTEQPVGNT